MSLQRTVAVSVVTIGVVLGAVALASRKNDDHPAAPAPALTPGVPGTLIAKAPLGGAPDGATAWRIYYRSMAENGTPVEISGVVIVPAQAAPAGGRDIVSWGHSTVGIAGSCAPSSSPSLFSDIAGLAAFLKAGDVVVASDFQGLGTAGPQPYLVGISSGRAMIDAVRAARAVPGTDAGKHYVLWGESQGGHAALWAARLAPDYAPDLDLLGVAAAAPPTDLITNFDSLSNPIVRALMVGYTSDAWSKIYGIPLSTFANGIGRFLIHRLGQDCLRLDAPTTLTNVTLLLASRQLPGHLGTPWLKPLRDNSFAPVHLAVPMLITQGGEDEVVMPKVTADFVRQSCRLGDAVRTVVIPDGTHSTIAAKSAATATDWIAARFAGKPPVSDCTSAQETLGAR